MASDLLVPPGLPDLEVYPPCLEWTRGLLDSGMITDPQTLES